MATAIKEKTLTFRVSADDHARLCAAASVMNETLTDFALRPALARADEVLARADVTLIPADQFAALMAALDEPVTPIDALVAVAAQPRMFLRA